uniref:Uncharacterized protein n=1 Tax=Quercus lobata TaxID=97700 RepID=A0A7N2R3R9_QUELO
MKWKGSDLQVVLRKVLQSKPPKHNVQNLRFGSSRSCNKVADVLAKKAKSGLELQVWRDDMPGDIASLVFADIR